MYQGAKWILLKQKKRSRKSHAWAPLSSACLIVCQEYMYTKKGVNALKSALKLRELFLIQKISVNSGGE